MAAIEYMLMRYVASQAPELLDKVKDLIEEYGEDALDVVLDLLG